MKNKISNGVKLFFWGGAQEVTGACYLLEKISSEKETSRILVDCGLVQGTKTNEAKNVEKFPFEPSSIDAVFITHAHIDHVGRIPKLIKDGFKGKIFSTAPTKELAEIMLLDGLNIMKKNKGRDNNGELIYSDEDIVTAMEQWNTSDYNSEFSVKDFKIKFRNSGHILGSTMVEIVVRSSDGQKGKKFVFTGDLGNSPNPILPDAEDVTGADFLIIESTYGDREHEEILGANLKLERSIEDTVNKNGVLMIPVFSLERTQKILFEINELVEHGRIPRVPIFLDSPLAIKATEIYKKNNRYFNETAKNIIKSGDEIFNFPGLEITRTSQESKRINDVPSPKIILAGSGMSNGGRIIHHELRYLSDPRSTLMLIGYQAVGSLGRQLQDGEKTVNILGQTVFVRAKIDNIRGYSAHPDINQLFDFVHKTSDTIKKVFVVQGEPRASLFFTQRLRDYLGIDAITPQYGDSFEFEL